MEIKRFFVTPDALVDNKIYLTGMAYIHLGLVLRAKVGYKVIICLNDGKASRNRPSRLPDASSRDLSAQNPATSPKPSSYPPRTLPASASKNAPRKSAKRSWQRTGRCTPKRQPKCPSSAPAAAPARTPCLRRSRDYKDPSKFSIDL